MYIMLFMLAVTLPYLKNNSIVLIHNCVWHVFCVIIIKHYQCQELTYVIFHFTGAESAENKASQQMQIFF